MSAKHLRIIALQCVFTLFIFISFIYFFVKYDSGQLKNQVNHIGQTLAFTIQEDVNISEGILASFAYNYEIDPDLDEVKFRTLAKHYLKVNPDIIYVQRKDKKTTTFMVYPDKFNYTLGATLLGRPEVEKAVFKAIKNKIVTANAPFVLKDTDALLGLVIRYPLYHEETFNGFFVVVMSVDNFLKGIIDAEMMKDYNISFFDDKENLFWGYDGPHKGHVYIKDISILDNFWTIHVSKKKYMPAATMEFVTGASILFLLVVGLLVVMQIRLIKRDQKIQHIASSKKELEKVKESYSLALDSVNDALWEWNIITGEIYTSDKWVEINGNEKGGQGVDAILQKESIHPEDYDQALFALEACLSGEKLTFDRTYRIIDPLGNCKWVQNRGKVIIDGRGDTTIMAGSISNITERKQAEIKLAESEALLARSQEIAHIGSWSLDLTTNNLYWSDEVYRIFGCEAQEFAATYKAFFEFTHPDDRAAVDEAYSRSVSEGSDKYEIEHRILRQDTDEIRYVHERCVHVRDDAGAIIQSIGMVQDITERKQAEEKLAQMSRLMQNSQEIAHLGSFEYVAADQTTIWSEEEYRIYGLDPNGPSPEYEMMLGKCIHPDDAKLLHDTFMAAMQNQGVYELEHRIVRPDGSVRWVFDKAHPYFDEKGKLLRYVGATLDITARKHAQEELKTLNAQLELKVEQRTAQLEASNKELEAFSYSVSHDLRAPLRHISGYVDLLNKRFQEALPEKAGHYLNEITDSAKQMGILIDDLLHFSRTGRQKLQQENMNMNAAVQEALEKLKMDTKNRKITWSVAELPWVYGDYSLLKQVWINLLENAIKYTRYKDEAEIEVGFTREPDQWEFYVRDNGAGFDIQYAHKLFGVFQRLHSPSQFEGTGIGLANVKRIVHKHGGQVRAEGWKDEGAAFYFTIPLKTFDEEGSS